jgi:Leucine-rich repeat (LRR) protein
MKLFTIALTFLFLVGCDRYQLTINERPIYAPKQLFSDYQIPDPGLNSCIKQAIIDRSIKRGEDLRSINCSYAGIENLDGLKRFTGLTTINLANNRLTNIKPLMFFGQLSRLDLSGNESLACADIETIRELLPTELVAPQHCL